MGIRRGVVPDYGAVLDALASKTTSVTLEYEDIDGDDVSKLQLVANHPSFQNMTWTRKANGELCARIVQLPGAWYIPGGETARFIKEMMSKLRRVDILQSAGPNYSTSWPMPRMDKIIDETTVANRIVDEAIKSSRTPRKVKIEVAPDPMLENTRRIRPE